MVDYRDDAGYVGQIQSLAGVLGRAGLGLVTSGYANDVSTGVEVAQANPSRVWLTVQNTSNENSSNADIRVQLGTHGFYIYLKPYGSLLINKDLPWTGIVGVEPVGAGAKVRVIEASVQG